MPRQGGAAMGKGALVAGLGLMVVALVAMTARLGSGAARPVALAQDGSESGLEKQAKVLEYSARQYTTHAKSLMRKAQQRKAEAAHVQAIEMYLHAAQSELEAYSENVEGLVSATQDRKLRPDLTQFPKEAAELHALLDHSLGEADGAAVKIAKIGNGIGDAVRVGTVPTLPPRAARAKARGGAAKQAALAEPRTRADGEDVAADTADAADAADAAGTKKAASHQQVLRATSPSPLQTMGKRAKAAPATNLQKVQATLKQLGAVKAFAREAAHGKARAVAASALLSSVKKAAARGVTHQLQQQPAPLLGAMNVRDGELIDGDPKYKPDSVGLMKEDPKFIEQQNSLMPEYNPDEDKLLACDDKCQKEIVHSTIGVTFKVATKCVPGCAKGDYTLNVKGRALPEWKTAQELQEQDAFCDNDPVYMKCKWESLDALCDKMTDFMPQYCLGHPNEGICKQCVKVEL